MSHTKGPWRVVFGWTEDHHAIVGLDANEVATIDCLSNASSENARLIAACPDLLDALVTALPYVEMALEDSAYKPGAVDRVLVQIRDAIAKAEGMES